MPDEQLKPLPWFTFNVKAYVTDTMRLNTEQHGAYLLLLLDCYATASFPPDDDEVLATITRLPVGVWQRHRPLILPYFRIEDRRWVHDRVLTELRDGNRRHAEAVASAAKASAAAAAKRASGPGPIRAPAPVKPAKKSVPDTVATPTPAPAPAPAPTPQEQEQEHLSLRESSSRAHEALEVDSQVKVTAPPIQSSDLTEIDPDWAIGEVEAEAAHDVGLTDAEIDTEGRSFLNTHLANGKMSKDWLASWKVWCLRAIERRPKQAVLPRIEVDVKPDWPKIVDFWKRNGLWQRGNGGAPGEVSCKCPAEVLIAAGIDPKTGFKLAEAKSA